MIVFAAPYYVPCGMLLQRCLRPDRLYLLDAINGGTPTPITDPVAGTYWLPSEHAATLALASGRDGNGVVHARRVRRSPGRD